LKGPAGLADSEAQRFPAMMTFANVEGYLNLLSASGCQVSIAEGTGRLASHFELYLKMIELQLTYDVIADGWIPYRCAGNARRLISFPSRDAALWQDRASTICGCCC
jgi:hypothetical protein